MCRFQIAGIAILAAVAACSGAPARFAAAPGSGTPAGTPAPHGSSAGSTCSTTDLIPGSSPNAGTGHACVRLGRTVTVRNGSGQPSGLEVWRLTGDSAPAVLACTSNPRPGNPVGIVCHAVKPGVAVLGMSIGYVSGGIAQPENTPVWHVRVTVRA